MRSMALKNHVRRVSALAAISLGAALVSGCVMVPVPGYHGPSVTVAPPAYPSEAVGVSPGAGYFWIGGHWGWGGGRHVWVPGRWMAHREGHRWEPHRWHSQGGGWRESGGHWKRH